MTPERSCSMTIQLKPRGGNVLEAPTVQIPHYQFNGVSGNDTLTEYKTTYPSYKSETWSGQDIVNFHTLKRKGVLLPHTTWEKTSIDYSNAATYVNYLDNPDPYPDSIDRYVGNAATQPVSTGILTVDNLDDYVASAEPQRLAQDAAAAIYQTGFDALTFLAELTHIPKLFSKTAKKVLSLKVPRNWRDLSNDWLAYRYGWRPTINEIKSLYELYLDYNYEVERLTERRSQKFSTNENFSEAPGISMYWYYYYSGSIRYEVSLKGSVCADIAVPPLQFNPLQTAWELIPYSFVIDWFVNAGNVLSAAAFVSTAVDYVASCGYLVTGIKRRSRTITGLKGGCTSHSSSCNQSCTTSVERRTPCAIPLTPFRTVRLDRYKIADLVALLVQRFRR